MKRIANGLCIVLRKQKPGCDWNAEKRDSGRTGMCFPLKMKISVVPLRKCGRGELLETFSRAELIESGWNCVAPLQSCATTVLRETFSRLELIENEWNLRCSAAELWETFSRMELIESWWIFVCSAAELRETFYQNFCTYPLDKS